MCAKLPTITDVAARCIDRDTGKHELKIYKPRTQLDFFLSISFQLGRVSDV